MYVTYIANVCYSFLKGRVAPASCFAEIMRGMRKKETISFLVKVLRHSCTLKLLHKGLGCFALGSYFSACAGDVPKACSTLGLCGAFLGNITPRWRMLLCSQCYFTFFYILLQLLGGVLLIIIIMLTETAAGVCRAPSICGQGAGWEAGNRGVKKKQNKQRCGQTKLVVETLGEEDPKRGKDGAWEEEEDAGLGGNARKMIESHPWALCHFMSPPEYPWHVWDCWGAAPASKAQAQPRALIPAISTDLPSRRLTTFIVK